MRIFLKDIGKNELHLVNKFPIHCLIFTLEQQKAEEIREVVEKTPFYVTILGEANVLPKYELEELIFFCKLQGLIINSDSFKEELSCPFILNPGLTRYNVFIKKGDKVVAAYLPCEELWAQEKQVLALVLTGKEFIKCWPKIKNFWLSF